MECSSSLPEHKQVTYGHYTNDPQLVILATIKSWNSLCFQDENTQLRTGKTDSNLAASSSKMTKLKKLALSNALRRLVSLQT